MGGAGWRCVGELLGWEVGVKGVRGVFVGCICWAINVGIARSALSFGTDTILPKIQVNTTLPFVNAGYPGLPD